MKINFITLTIITGLASIGNAQGYFSDDFSSASQLDNYGVDRESPQSYNTGTYFGHSALNMHVGMTQPRQTRSMTSKDYSDMATPPTLLDSNSRQSQHD
jgi:hypothetical protein